MQSSENKDYVMVAGAGNSLRTMMEDLMGILQGEAGAQVFLSGEMKLHIQGRGEYTISLLNEDQKPGGLKVGMKVNDDTSTAISEHNKQHKRQLEPIINDAIGGYDASKRLRVDGDNNGTQSTEDVTVNDQDHELPIKADMANVMDNLHNISNQIRWLENCRRLAESYHVRRDEQWQATSATFHEESRKVREKHQAWMVAEMSWQRDVLQQIKSEIKGLYPLGHSLKWETPAHLISQQAERAPPQPPTSDAG